MDASTIPLLLVWFVVFVFSTTLHEAGHAFVARRLGDPTAYHGGQVSLNPLPHILREPFGMVVVPILSFILMSGNWMIGWASAPYDPRWAAHYPKRAALMAAAGPTGNLLLTVFAGLGMRLGLATGYFGGMTGSKLSDLVSGTSAPASGGLASLLSVTFVLNLVLLIFNLFPIPPLDGSSVIQIAMPEDAARKYQALLANPMWGLVGLIAAWRLFPYIFNPIFTFALDVVYGPR